MGSIRFFYEETSFKLKNLQKLKSWIKKCIQYEEKSLVHLNYIICSDEYLAKINQEYLNHNTYTDIVTFDNSEPDNGIEGDIFVSIDRIKENASKFQILLEDELHRVIIHGVLHLLGYSDKGKAQSTIMREKEDAYLSLREFRE
jgi:rRNA maturation RNase YbeY